MVCALIGIVVAFMSRAALHSIGLLEEMPAPFLAFLAIACTVTFGVWLVWLA